MINPLDLNYSNSEGNNCHRCKPGHSIAIVTSMPQELQRTQQLEHKKKLSNYYYLLLSCTTFWSAAPVLHFPGFVIYFHHPCPPFLFLATVPANPKLLIIKTESKQWFFLNEFSFCRSSVMTISAKEITITSPWNGLINAVNILLWLTIDHVHRVHKCLIQTDFALSPAHSFFSVKSIRHLN